MANGTTFATSLKAIVVASVFVAMRSVAAAQVSLSDVDVRLVRTPHGGCATPCSRYAVTVRGDGIVTDDGTVIASGAGQVAGVRTRSIPVDRNATPRLPTRFGQVA